MEPRTFHIFRQIHYLNFTVNFHHVKLQLCQEAGSVAPAEPRIVTVNKNGGVDIVPPSTLTVVCHVVADKRTAYGIYERTGRTVADSNADSLAYVGFTALNCSVIIEFTILFNHLRCPCLANSPLEISRAEHRAVVCPGLHIIGRIAQPFGDVELLASRCRILAFVKLVVAHIEIQTPVMYHRSRVGGKLVADNRIAVKHKRLQGIGGIRRFGTFLRIAASAGTEHSCQA